MTEITKIDPRMSEYLVEFMRKIITKWNYKNRKRPIKSTTAFGKKIWGPPKKYRRIKENQ